MSDEEWERKRRNRGHVQNSVCIDKLSFYGERTSKLCFSHFSAPFPFSSLSRISFAMSLAFVSENRAFSPSGRMWYVGRTIDMGTRRRGRRGEGEEGGIWGGRNHLKFKKKNTTGEVMGKKRTFVRRARRPSPNHTSWNAASPRGYHTNLCNGSDDWQGAYPSRGNIVCQFAKIIGSQSWPECL